MRPDKSDSFMFHRNTATTESNRSQHCRRKLQNTFEHHDSASCSRTESNSTLNRSVLSSLSLNETRRALRQGADRLTKTLSTVRTHFGTLTQKLKTSTKRRRILEEGPMTPNCETPQTFSRAVLGRTPTQLYSPFSIETPSPAHEKENQTPGAHAAKAGWCKKRNLLDDIGQ